MADDATKEIAPAANGVRFTVASRPQSRYSNVQTFSNLAGGGSFAPIQLPATGFVRKLHLFFTAAMACASGGGVVAGDAPFNLVGGVTVTDATGQPVMQPINGYNLYLVNKYFSSGGVDTNIPRAYADPQVGPEYNYAATATTGVAVFRLDIDFEIDYNSGYGCIPNLDANASLQVKIDVNNFTNAFAATSPSSATLAVRLSQYYWAPVADSIGGQPVNPAPVGLGDYLETRYETQTVNAGSENLVTVTNRGGMIKGQLIISRNAGVRTAFAPGTPVGLILDNNPIDEGILLEEKLDLMRRTHGYIGADLTTSYAPLTPGVLPGLDRGVLTQKFDALSGGRDSWLSTRVGSLLQLRLTPGAGAGQLEIISQIAQVRNSAAFFASSALD